MKHPLLAALSFAVGGVLMSGCASESATVEPDASLDGLSSDTALAVAEMVQGYGWPCGSVSSLRHSMIRELGPENYNAEWIVGCNSDADRYRLIEQRRGDDFSFKVTTLTEFTVKVGPPEPNLAIQILRFIWIAITEEPWIPALVFGLAMLGWYVLVGLGRGVASIGRLFKPTTKPPESPGD